ncbi:MAG: 3-deoxy-D-manno-octulosonic acid transferase [Chitinophagaceae bacterium]|nr:3-deoxy-D-manno-octulosonic acid transferase [Chitinophagaceae bacterium]
MGLILYNFFLFLYQAGARLAGYWSPKASQWVQGRKHVFTDLQSALAQKKYPLVWMHCASLGEFEQGRPLLDAIRQNYPRYKLLVTFFSPSGYEIRKNYKGADIVCYLPMDSAANAKRLLDTIQPDLVLWVKYEYWFYYLREIKRRNIPLLLISGTFRDDQPFFSWYGGLHRRMLGFFTHFFLQTRESAEKLATLHLPAAITISGDTRFDRVSDIADIFEPVPPIEAFCGHHPVIVAGSTWPEDEEELDHYANTHPDIKILIAPHEISEDHIRDIEKLFSRSVRFSALLSQRQREGGAEPSVLIIDNIGMLSKLYYYAHISYVGGGFGGDGLHNILEPAAHGKPVIFGPNYEKFPEAGALIDEGGAFTVDNALELEKLLDKLFGNPELLKTAGVASGKYVAANKGATQTILHYIQENRLLTS